MRCLACGAEMQVAEVVRDDTMMVPGYERRTLRCSGCDDVEHRLVFNPDGAARAAAPASAASAPPVATLSFNSTPAAAAPAEAAPIAPLASAPPPPEAPPPEPVTVPAPAPAAAAPPVEPEPPVPGSPAAIKSDEERAMDEGEELLRRAIEIMRGPRRAAAPSKGPIDVKPASPAALADAIRTKKPLTGRMVRIQRDLVEPAYVAMDTTTGLSVLRHQDSARLRAMCDRIGWQVIDG